MQKFKSKKASKNDILSQKMIPKFVKKNDERRVLKKIKKKSKKHPNQSIFNQKSIRCRKESGEVVAK